MKTMKLIVKTSGDYQTVIIGAETTANDQVEERSYVLAPTVAVEVANSILHAAELCGVEVHVQTNRGISSMQRLALIARAGHIMRTMSGRKADKIALQIVDSILAEIL